MAIIHLAQNGQQILLNLPFFTLIPTMRMWLWLYWNQRYHPLLKQRWYFYQSQCQIVYFYRTHNSFNFVSHWKKTVNKKHRTYYENFNAEGLIMTKTRNVAEVARSMGIEVKICFLSSVQMKIESNTSGIGDKYWNGARHLTLVIFGKGRNKSL